MAVDLLALWVVGVFVAVPVIAWWARDLARIPSPAWFWTGRHRRPWQWGVLLGWIAGGGPSIVVVLVWSRSEDRRDLLEEANDMHHRARW